MIRLAAVSVVLLAISMAFLHHAANRFDNRPKPKKDRHHE